VRARLEVRTDDEDLSALLRETAPLLDALARVAEVAAEPAGAPRPRGAATAVVEGAEILVPLKGLVDVSAERARLEREGARARRDLESARKKLGNDRFVSRAPADVVSKERARAEESGDRLAKIEEALSRLEEVEEQ